MTTLWLADKPLLLASGSRTRHALLTAAGIPVEVMRPQIDERVIESGLTVAELVAAELAEAKARDVSWREQDRLVLGADQTLTCDGRAFHKPADLTAAADQLVALSGRRHALTSAYCIARRGEVLARGEQIAHLQMRQLSSAFIESYLRSVGPNVLASVGGYQLEGIGVQLFERVDGDHFTILGLPLLRVLATLRDLGCLPR